MAEGRGISLGQGLTILANAGVVVGLVFVGLELQQTRVSLQAEVELGLLDAQQTSLRGLAENPELARAVMSAYTRPDSLEPVSMMLFMAHVSDLQQIAYSAYELHALGAISDATWERHADFHASFFRTEWSQEFWTGNVSGIYPDGFVQDIVARFPQAVDMNAVAAEQGTPSTN